MKNIQISRRSNNRSPSVHTSNNRSVKNNNDNPTPIPIPTTTHSNKNNRSSNKRSVESLIDQSSIIDQHNDSLNNADLQLQLKQIKKAYNQTCRSMNEKVAQQAEKIQRYKLKSLRLQEANVKIVEKRLLLQDKVNEQTEYINKVQLINQRLKRKCAYLQGKLQQIKDHQNLASKGYDDEKPHPVGGADTLGLPSNALVKRGQLYKEISQIIQQKVREFANQLRAFTMTEELEQKIQNFMQDLIYITPLTGNMENIKLADLISKDRHIGAISRRQLKLNNNTGTGPLIIISDQDQWKQLQQSIDNLYSVGDEENIERGSRRVRFQKQYDDDSKSYQQEDQEQQYYAQQSGSGYKYGSGYGKNKYIYNYGYGQQQQEQGQQQQDHYNQRTQRQRQKYTAAINKNNSNSKTSPVRRQHHLNRQIRERPQFKRQQLNSKGSPSRQPTSRGKVKRIFNNNNEQTNR